MKNRILCVGEILWDALPKGLFLGGAPFNVACHLHMLGKEVIMVSRVGKDVLGDQVIRRMKQKGISTRYIQFDAKHSTGIVNVTLDQLDNPSYEIVEPVAWDFIELTDELVQVAKQAKMIVFGSLAQRDPVSRHTIQELRKLNPLTVFDINLRSPYLSPEIVKESLLDSCIIKLNEDELLRLAGWFHLQGEPRETAVQLAEKFDCQTICVTKGANGAALWHKGVWSEHEGFEVEVKDTVGAGDAFLAALLSGILSGDENNKILEFANAVGAFVVSSDGPTPLIDMEKIRVFRFEKEQE